MAQAATLKGLKCPNCGSEHLRVTGVKGALGASLTTGIAFGAIGNLVAGKCAAENITTEPLQYKCNDCGNTFESLPLYAPPEDILSAPCGITFTRESNFVGAAVPQIVYLNGVKLCAIKNGASISFATENRYNTIFVTDQYGLAFKSECRFEALPGGSVSVRFNRKDFIANNALPPASSPAMTVSAEVAPTPAEPRAQINAPPLQGLPPVRFCTNCGAALQDGMSFCEHCGTKRFVPEPAAAVRSAPSVSKPKPKRALVAFGLLAAAWMLALVFQGIFKRNLNYNSDLSFNIVASMLGASVFMLLQRELKYKLYAIGSGLLTALLSAASSMAVLINNKEFGNFSLAEVFVLNHPFFWSSFWRALIFIALTMGITFGVWVLLKTKEEKPRLRLTAWIGAAVYGGGGLVTWLVQSGSPMGQMTFIFILPILLGYVSDALMMYLSIRFVDALCKENRSRTELYGAGKAWAWIAAISMCLSVILILAMGFGGIENLGYTASLLLAVSGAVGYILLLAKKRAGLYIILVAAVLVLGGQFSDSLSSMLYGFPYASLLIGSLFGAVNPLLAWFAVRAADRRSSLPVPVTPNVTQKDPGFHKFTAIFNIVVGALLIIPIIGNLASNPQADFVVTFLLLTAVYLTFGILAVKTQRSRMKPYPMWMKVINILLFSIAALFIVIMITGISIAALS